MSFRVARVAPEKRLHRPPAYAIYSGGQGEDMASTRYSELLRDPRWQKVRLKKLEQAEWKCELCSGDDKTFNVHHKRYIKGHMPWEYDLAELAVLCEACHEVEHEAKDAREALMARLAVDGPISSDCFVAHGAGALSLVYPLICEDKTLMALLDQVESAQPMQFAAGRIGSAFADLALRPEYRFGLVALNDVVDLLECDSDFADELMKLLAKYGVDRCGSPFEAGNA